MDNYDNYTNFNFTAHDLETSVIAKDYPYGRLRTNMHYFVEYREGFGWRPVTQSLNPKTNKMNKPHPGNYSIFPVFVAEEKDTGHTVFVHFPHVVGKPSDWQAYINTFWAVLPELYRETIRMIINRSLVRSPDYYKDVKIVYPEVVK